MGVADGGTELHRESARFKFTELYFMTGAAALNGDDGRGRSLQWRG